MPSFAEVGLRSHARHVGGMGKIQQELETPPPLCARLEPRACEAERDAGLTGRHVPMNWNKVSLIRTLEFLSSDSANKSMRECQTIGDAQPS